jgi:glutamate synthase (NADPH/NADH) small chain
MGKITGFMEYERRRGPQACRAPEKLQGFVIRLDDPGGTQARCMDCGTPFCNSGCPVNKYS